MSDYLVSFGRRDLELVLQVLDYFAMHGDIFGKQAQAAAQMSEELAALMRRQDDV